MTKLEIQNAIESDPVSLINFVALNNPSDLILSEHVAGYKTVTTIDEAKNVLTTLVQQGKKDEFILILKGVPYVNDAPNETAGFKDYFLGKLSPEDRIKYQQDINSRPVAPGLTAEASPEVKSTWLNIGSGVVGIVGSIFGAKAAVSNATYLDAQARATQAQTIKIIVLVVVALLVLAGVVFAFKQAKTSK